MKKRPVKKPRVAPVEKPKTGGFIRGVGGKTTAEILEGARRFCEKERSK